MKIGIVLSLLCLLSMEGYCQNRTDSRSIALSMQEVIKWTRTAGQAESSMPDLMEVEKKLISARGFRRKKAERLSDFYELHHLVMQLYMLDALYRNFSCPTIPKGLTLEAALQIDESFPVPQIDTTKLSEKTPYSADSNPMRAQLENFNLSKRIYSSINTGNEGIQKMLQSFATTLTMNQKRMDNNERIGINYLHDELCSIRQQMVLMELTRLKAAVHRCALKVVRNSYKKGVSFPTI